MRSAYHFSEKVLKVELWDSNKCSGANLLNLLCYCIEGFPSGRSAYHFSEKVLKVELCIVHKSEGLYLCGFYIGVADYHFYILVILVLFSDGDKISLLFK